LGKPVLFSQWRPGKGGRLFCLHKFRSMTDDRGGDGRLLPDAQRLTSFGRWLRATSLDELPELWNILKGDMSFVGPRPQLVRDMVFFNAQQMQRQSVYPGLTGLAQIRGRNRILWEKKFQYDLEYVQCISFAEDMKILWHTFFQVAGQVNIAAEGMATAEDFGDYLLRTGKISEAEYWKGIVRAEHLLHKVEI